MVAVIGILSLNMSPAISTSCKSLYDRFSRQLDVILKIMYCQDCNYYDFMLYRYHVTERVVCFLFSSILMPYFNMWADTK